MKSVKLNENGWLCKFVECFSPWKSWRSSHQNICTFIQFFIWAVLWFSLLVVVCGAAWLGLAKVATDILAKFWQTSTWMLWSVAAIAGPVAFVLLVGICGGLVAGVIWLITKYGEYRDRKYMSDMETGHVPLTTAIWQSFKEKTCIKINVE